MTDNTTNNDTATSSDGVSADENTDDTTTDSTAAAVNNNQTSTTQNDPAKNKKLAEVTMSEPMRDLLTFEITLPGIYRGMRTNQFLWIDVAEDFYDDFYSEIMDTIGLNKFNRYAGFKEGRFYIEKKTWKYNLKDGVTTELQLNPIPSPYSEYMKYQLDAEKALDQAIVDATRGSGGGGTSTGGALGSDAIEVGNALASKYHFCSGACQTYACMQKSGCGSCWAWSEALYTELKKIGYTVRIIQYDSGISNNHRSVQYKDASGNWVDYPYRSTNIESGARNTTNKPGMFVYMDENGQGGK